jgi:nucleoside-diphosphate-sugar epimerase
MNLHSYTRILVTGGAGFIASSLAEKLAQNPDNYVIVIDNLQTGTLEKIPESKFKNLRFIKCDVNEFREISSIFYSYSFDFVFHYAATVGVKRTLQNPVKVLSDISGIKYMLSLAKNTGVKRFYFSSSSEVYGEPVEFPQNEDTTPLNSRLPYAIVKNVGEAYLKSYKKEFNLDYTIFRFFNTFGPKQSKDFVISRFIAAALSGKDLTIYGDGNQTRTFCYIDDNITATTNAFYQNLFVNDVVNVGGDLETTIVDLAKIILDMTKSKSKIKHLSPLKEGDMTRRRPDISKMNQLLNGTPVTLEEGLKKILADTRHIF